MIRKLTFVLSGLLIMLLLSTLLVGWPFITLYNTVVSDRYLESLQNIEFPDKLMAINSSKRFGVLAGNGNHCDCEIAVLFESTMEIHEFENFAKTSISLKSPFSDLGNSYSELFYVQGEQLYRIYNTDTIPLVHHKAHNSYAIADPFEFHLENGQYRAIREMVANTERSPSKNHFVVTAFDQTFTGLSMRDMRCH